MAPLLKTAGIRDRARRLLSNSESLTIHVLTADTHGTFAAECQSIPFFWTPSQRLMLLPINFRNSKKPERPVACIGNGRNDLFMLKEAALSIAVIDRGMYPPSPALLRSVCALLRGSAGALSSSETDHRRTTWIRQPRGWIKSPIQAFFLYLADS